MGLGGSVLLFQHGGIEGMSCVRMGTGERSGRTRQYSDVSKSDQSGKKATARKSQGRGERRGLWGLAREMFTVQCLTWRHRLLAGQTQLAFNYSIGPAALGDVDRTSAQIAAGIQTLSDHS